MHYVGEDYSGDRDGGHLYLMQTCKNHIIENSSFSWWSDFLANSYYTIAPKKLRQDGGGCEIIELGSKTIKEKSKKLQDAHTVITQLGSNCMNLIFNNSIKNVLFLSNDFPVGKDYYFQLIDILNPIQCDKQIFEYGSTIYGADVKNSTNNPFLIDIYRISNYIYNLN